MRSNPPDALATEQNVPTDVAQAIARAAPRFHGMDFRVRWLASTSSTNDVAARLAEAGAEEGTVVVADMQTAGRGRHGRHWFSPPGAGLYVSMIVRPEAGLSSADNPTALLTLASGVATATAVRASTGLPAQIKWPNDVLVGGRKLAGILAESAMQGGALQFVVIGLGVNLEPAAYPPDLASRVTSVGAETSRPADRALLLAEILSAMAGRYADLRAGKFDAILSAWRELAWSVPGKVEWDSPCGVVRGIAEDIDRDGALLVRAGEKIVRIVSGEVRWIRE